MKNISKSEEISTLKRSIKSQLTGQQFRGTYVERRYVSNLQSYRDIVIVPDNVDTNQNMEVYLRHARYLMSRINLRVNNILDDYWIGITSPQMPGAPAGGFAIWTELSDLPFGSYAFFVKKVSFRDDEMILKLGIVDERNVFDEINRNTDEIHASLEDILNVVTGWRNAILREIYLFLRYQVTRENIKAAIQFLFALLMLLLFQSRDFLKVIGIYSLQFMAEFRKLMHTLTPIILALIDLTRRIIGAIFLIFHQLLFSRDNNRPPQQNMILYSQRRARNF